MGQIDYNTWYNSWMKRLAKNMTKEEVAKEILRVEDDIDKATESHLRAIESTSSMQGNSARRAHARNAVSVSGDYKIALNGALEIHEKFPEHAKRS